MKTMSVFTEKKHLIKQVQTYISHFNSDKILGEKNIFNYPI